MDALVFSALRRRGENGGNITLASPPSRRFLTRPHCVLLPLYLSLSSRPPPAQHQTAALAVFLFFFPIFFFLLFIIISCCTFRVTQTSAQQFTSSRCCWPNGRVTHITPFFFFCPSYVFIFSTSSRSGFLRNQPDCKMTSYHPLFSFFFCPVLLTGT